MVERQYSICIAGARVNQWGICRGLGLIFQSGIGPTNGRGVSIQYSRRGQGSTSGGDVIRLSFSVGGRGHSMEVEASIFSIPGGGVG